MKKINKNLFFAGQCFRYIFQKTLLFDVLIMEQKILQTKINTAESLAFLWVEKRERSQADTQHLCSRGQRSSEVIQPFRWSADCTKLNIYIYIYTFF